MAGAGQSIQTLYLQMAVAKEYGIAEYKKLNPLFVNLSHPDGLARPAVRPAGHGLLPCAAVPVPALEKGMHKVLSSYDVMGGPASFLSVWSTSKFRDENPKAFKAVVDAFREATDLINTNRRKAAEIYSADTGGKEKRGRDREASSPIPRTSSISGPRSSSSSPTS